MKYPVYIETDEKFDDYCSIMCPFLNTTYNPTCRLFLDNNEHLGTVTTDLYGKQYCRCINCKLSFEKEE